MEARRTNGPKLPWPWLALAISGALSCGTSIQAVYEGDVRFEHCMALDSRPDVKPTLRRACWEEWQKFYTFGQTRDRVEWAHMREKQLSTASDFDEGDWALESARNSKAVPEPTSALAPPPMTLGPQRDAGAPETGSGSPAPATSASAGPSEHTTPPSSDCTAECEEGWGLCRQECKTPACEKACTGKY